MKIKRIPILCVATGLLLLLGFILMQYFYLDTSNTSGGSGPIAAMEQKLNMLASQINTHLHDPSSQEHVEAQDQTIGQLAAKMKEIETALVDLRAFAAMSELKMKKAMVSGSDPETKEEASRALGAGGGGETAGTAAGDSVSRPQLRGPPLPPSSSFTQTSQVGANDADSTLSRESSQKSADKPSQAAALLGLDTVLVIIASNRPNYLERTLSHVLKYHPRTAVPIVISEDGFSAEVAKVVDKSRREYLELSPNPATRPPFLHVHHEGTRDPRANGYILLAEHFKWILDKVFSGGLTDLSVPVSTAIILEEDLEIAPDFFEYFAAVKNLVVQDSSLMAASAWNDNGLETMVKDPRALVRSDFFPGLGWMLPRRVWDELSPKWPRGYWDDWLREPEQRLERQFIRPEVCRTFHFGMHGVSNAQYSTFLTSIKLNQEFVPFTSLDLHYLEKSNWDKQYLSAVKSAIRVTQQNFDTVRSTYKDAKEYVVTYGTLSGPERDSFENLARWAGAMDNIKAKVPRTAYHGIVSIWKDNVRLHIAPRAFLS